MHAGVQWDGKVNSVRTPAHLGHLVSAVSNHASVRMVAHVITSTAHVSVHQDGRALFAVKFVLQASMDDNVARDASVQMVHPAITSQGHVSALPGGRVNSVRVLVVKVLLVFDAPRTAGVKTVRAVIT